MTLQQWMEATRFRITEGSEFGWRCYGSKAYNLSSWSGCNDTGYSADIIFDCETQTVYEFSLVDYRTNEHYRWIKPQYREAYLAECVQRDIRPNENWSDKDIVDLPQEQDLLDRYKTVINEIMGHSDQSRETVDIDIDDDVFFEMAIMAHKRDITINSMVEQILREELQKMESAGVKANESSS